MDGTFPEPSPELYRQLLGESLARRADPHGYVPSAIAVLRDRARRVYAVRGLAARETRVAEEAGRGDDLVTYLRDRVADYDARVAVFVTEIKAAQDDWLMGHVGTV